MNIKNLMLTSALVMGALTDKNSINGSGRNELDEKDASFIKSRLDYNKYVLDKRNGMKEFHYYNEEKYIGTVMARNKKNADRKAKNNGWNF